MKKSILIPAIMLLALLCTSIALTAQQNLAEKLGYDANTKLLIVHADDIGLAQSVNEASLTAFEKGGVTSGSIMVPCPWFADFAKDFKEHPDLDVGIHLTLTAEWDYYKWGGVLPATEIPSLLDEHGNFYASVEEVGQYADPAEVEKEVRAQIERAIAFGIQPTHIDTHMGSVMAKPEFMQIYLKLGLEYKIPVFVPRMILLGMPEEAREQIKRDYVLVDNFFMMNADDPGLSWAEAYGQMIEKVKPGLNVMIVHVANDNAEMQAISVNHPAFGSAWRARDLEYLLSQDFRDILTEQNIQLVSWKKIKETM
ncbi:MAG: polysaccharide deacetylase family protein [Candidatus Bathyarchaeota archaeon]|jgi:hypothetical protein|nr:polysaccharide deacetylase family protein [Candidatus Bathyarchaeota archaeon]